MNDYQQDGGNRLARKFRLSMSTVMGSFGNLWPVPSRRVGWDVPEAWHAHCCMLNDEEMKQFADNKVGIAHCPSSNMRLASGDLAFP